MITFGTARSTVTAATETVFGSLGVVAAGAINPEAIRASWLLESGVLRQDEMTNAPLITPALILVGNPNFQLVIHPGRFQLTFSRDSEDVDEPIKRIFGGFIAANAAMSISAIGVNFDYFVSPVATPFAEWNDKYFSSPLRSMVPNPEKPRSGSYFSCTVSPFRMKLDVKPINGAQGTDEELINLLARNSEWMNFKFNFHYEVQPTSGPTDYAAVIGSWRKVAEVARQIVGTYAAQ